MESESTKRRYNLLAEYIKGHDPLIFISFVKCLWPWQRIKILSPLAVLYAVFKKGKLSSYEIHQRKLPFKPKGDLTGSKIRDVILSPVITLKLAEIIKDKDIRLKKSMAIATLDDFVCWCASLDDTEIPIGKKILNYSNRIENASDKKVSSKEVENHLKEIFNFSTLDKTFKELEEKYPASNLINIEIRRAITQIKTHIEIIKAGRFKKSKAPAEFAIIDLSKTLDLYPSQFYHKEYLKLIHLLPNKNPPMGMIYVKELIHCLRKTRNDPILPEHDIEKDLYGKRVHVFLTKKLWSKLQNLKHSAHSRLKTI